MQPAPRKLLDKVRDAIRLKHFAYSTEQTYVQWIRRFILFHDKRHPEEMGRAEVEAFLSHLSTDQPSTFQTPSADLGHGDLATNVADRA